MGRLAKQLWPTASYWHLGQQPAEELDRLRPNWERLRREFGFPHDWNLGERLAAAVHAASRQTHGLDARHGAVAAADWTHAAHRTILHGDPKAPNFFFQAPPSVGTAAGESPP